MNRMQRYDFNLLVALDALLQEGSVRGAAERLSLTAPAMSHALARLRDLLGDPLLVRAGQRLVPTPRALALRDRVRQAVEGAQSILQERPIHDLKSVIRLFRVRANDSMISVFGARLLVRIRSEAPSLRIHFTGRSEEDVDSLRDGSVDLDIGVTAHMGPEICTQRLLDDDFVCAVRSGHPLSQRAMTMQSYAEANHIVAARRGRPAGPIDAVLKKADLTRQILVTVPDALAAMALAAASDCIATVPRSVAEWARLALRTTSISLPFAIPSITIYQSWHPRLSMDHAHQWLRECMIKTMQDT